MKLTITHVGTLLPVILDETITKEQVEQIQALIERGSLATLPLRTLQIMLGALTALEDPFADELVLTNDITAELRARLAYGNPTN